MPEEAKSMSPLRRVEVGLSHIFQPSEEAEEAGQVPFPEGVLTCPACGFEYLHLLRVEVHQGPGCGSRGVTVVGAVPHPPLPRITDRGTGRGSAVVVWMGCESGHRFCWQLAFHKGQVFASIEDAVEVPEGGPRRWAVSCGATEADGAREDGDGRMSTDGAGAQAADFLRRLAACPGLVGVEVRYADVKRYRHVYDPQTGAWWLLPAADLPRWVRRRGRPRRGHRLRIGSSRRGAGAGPQVASKVLAEGG